MSIFRRDPPSPAAPSSSAPVRPQPPTGGQRKLTHVAAGSKIVGVISGNTEVLIEGELEGEIKLDHRAVVGAQGKVVGNISARSVQIGGQLVGNVQGLERVELLASANLEGDLAAPRVVIAEGAFFKGQIEMTGRQSVGERPDKATTGVSGELSPARLRHENRDPQGS